VTTTECTADSDVCERSADCIARDVWLQVEEAVQDVLSGITLADLVSKSNVKAAEYQI
jgi:DNA-binding IscR family transcriptional regulator